MTRMFTAMDRHGQGVALLGLRLLLAWEFWEAGWGKLQGENWFADIQAAFPFPFNLLPAQWSWALATSTELVAALLLALGLATRLGSLSLIVLTVVAWASVHAGNGYNVCDNGWKLLLIYLAMLMPLLFGGAGRLSLDHWIESHLLSCKSCRA
ncbi:MAG: DoxX family protein [Hydrogenophilaceae bacterium]|nr:DoxX family protein [Hydrogenophilaceae bacterium]